MVVGPRAMVVTGPVRGIGTHAVVVSIMATASSGSEASNHRTLLPGIIIAESNPLVLLCESAKEPTR